MSLPKNGVPKAPQRDPMGYAMETAEQHTEVLDERVDPCRYLHRRCHQPARVSAVTWIVPLGPRPLFRLEMSALTGRWIHRGLVGQLSRRAPMTAVCRV